MNVFNKLSAYGNNYRFTKTNDFSPIAIPEEDLVKVKEFAYEMCFGEGHHRAHRTGGTKIRHAGELFCNTFQGKLAEVCIRKFLINNGLECGELDFDIYGENVWDDKDLEVNGRSISIKSAPSFGHLLLLETKDYDTEGNYLPNLNIGATAKYDYYVLVRIKPNIKGLFGKQKLLYTDNIPLDKIEEIINSEKWYYDIAGWINHNEFVEIIRNQNIIPKDALLGKYTIMDATNYYAQSGDLHNANELLNELKQQ